MDKINLIQSRDFIVKHIYSKIVLIEQNDKFVKNSIFINIFERLPFVISSNMLSFLGYNYLIETDDLIYYSKNNNVKLGPLLLEIKLDSQDLKEIFYKYDNNVPIWLILADNNIFFNNDSEINICCLKQGVKISKNFLIDTVLNLTKVELLTTEK